MKPAAQQLIAECSRCAEGALSDSDRLCALLEAAIAEAGLTLADLRCKRFDPLGATIVAIISQSHVVLHSYPEADHLSVDVFTCGADLAPAYALLGALEKALAPGCVRTAELRRGTILDFTRPGWVQLTSTDGMDIRLQAAETIFTGRSEYQNIAVVESRQFGRLLVLDDQLQLAERDSPLYNRALCEPLQRRGASFENVLLLGGGDGALAAELLRQNAAHLTVVDIDPAVSRVGRDFFPQLCGAAFAAGNCQFEYSDALRYLDAAPQGAFDTGIYDLTMHPEAFTDRPRREYLSGLFSALRAAMCDGAVLSIQCCSGYDLETRALLADLLTEEFGAPEFEEHFVPSLCRPWLFAVVRCER